MSDIAGKAPMPSTPLVWPMTQMPQYSMTTFQVPNASSSANLLPTQQRFMSQAGYANPAMTTNYQPSTSLVPMNANSVWIGQLTFPHTT